MAEERPAKRQKAVHPIDAANSRTDEDFLKDYMRPRYPMALGKGAGMMLTSQI
jgi:hypothetical protein